MKCNCIRFLTITCYVIVLGMCVFDQSCVGLKSPDKSLLAKDFAKAGFDPMVPWKEKPGDIINKRPTMAVPGTAVDYRNGSLLIDDTGIYYSKGVAYSITCFPPNPSSSGSSDHSNLSVLRITTYKGGDFYNLTKGELIALYGAPLRGSELAKADSLDYRYKTADGGIETIGISFNGPGNNVKISLIHGFFETRELQLGKV